MPICVRSRDPQFLRLHCLNFSTKNSHQCSMSQREDNPPRRPRRFAEQVYKALFQLASISSRFCLNRQNMDSTESVITMILSYVVQPTEFWNEQLPNRSMLRNSWGFVGHLINRTHSLAYLGLDRYFKKKFSYIARRGSNNGIASDIPPPVWIALTNDTRPQWKTALKEMERIWKILVGGTLLLIPYAHIFSILTSTNSKNADYL